MRRTVRVSTLDERYAGVAFRFVPEVPPRGKPDTCKRFDGQVLLRQLTAKERAKNP